MKGEIFNLNGSHLTLDCKGCDRALISDSFAISEFLDSIVKILGMNKLIEPIALYCNNGTNSWDKGGVSAFVMIAESHIAIHTFPQAKLLTADIYSCKPFDVETAVKEFERSFHPEEIIQNLILREIQQVREKEMVILSHEN